MDESNEQQINILGQSYEILLDEYYAISYYFIDTKFAYIYWRRPPSFVQYKNAFECFFTLPEEQKIDYFVSNIVNQGITSLEKSNWYREVALPNGIKKGLKKAAVIMDDNPFRKFYISIAIKLTKSAGLPFKSFSDLQTAVDWLND